MRDDPHTQLIAELAREQVAELAPDELPLFRPTCEAFFRDPEKALKPEKARDEMLGFGAVTALSFLTPIILAVVVEVVNFLAAEIAKSVKSEGAEAVNDAIKRLFKKLRPQADGAEQTGAPRLTAEQLAQVRSLAFEKARKLNMPEAEAALLADSLVGSLVLPA